MANKTKYDPKITPTIILWMSRSGLVDSEMAKELKISRKTLHNWKKKYPEVKQALRAGKNWFDASVEQKLFQRAVGYKSTEVTITYKYLYKKKSEDGSPILDPETGKHMKQITGETHNTRDIPPDNTSIIFWLKNRQPEKWNDVYNMKHSGKIENEHKTVHINYDKLSEEEAKELFRNAMLKDDA